MVSSGLLSEMDDDEEYFDSIDFHSMDDDELQRLSPRRRYLIEFERLLEVELPATRKIHRGDNWRKNSPNVTNADLKQLIIGICQTYGETPKVAKELRTDALHLHDREQDVFDCLLDAGDEYQTAEEIADALGDVEPATIRVYLYRMREKVDFQSRRRGHKKEFRLPPGYRKIAVSV